MVVPYFKKVYLSIEGHLDCFQFLVIVKKVAKTFTNGFLRGYVFKSVGYT